MHFFTTGALLESGEAEGVGEVMLESSLPLRGVPRSLPVLNGVIGSLGAVAVVLRVWLVVEDGLLLGSILEAELGSVGVAGFEETTAEDLTPS